MRNGKKNCKACAAAKIGKTMAKTRKSNGKNILKDVAYYTGGAVGGAFLVPKLVDMVDPSGTFDTKIVNGGALALSVLGAMNTKGDIQKLFIGAAVGSGASLVNEVVMNGMGYVISPSYDVNRVMGPTPQARGEFAGTTGANPGAF